MAPMRLIRAFSPGMTKKGSGAIISIGEAGQQVIRSLTWHGPWQECSQLL